jgi:hypothetical protein
MDKIGWIAVIVVLAPLTYIALSKPISVIRWMHGWRASWNKVITYEQSTMRELADNDPLEYERKYPVQLNIVRLMGLISMLIVIASLCMLFN